MPIDRKSRQIAKNLLQAWRSNNITNYQFEDKWPSKTQDRALEIIEAFEWEYDEYPEVPLRWEETSDDVKPAIERSILFLGTNLEYEWPRVQWAFAPIPVVDKLLKTEMKWEKQFDEFKKCGDFSVWPFLRRSDYEKALTEVKSSGKD